MKKYDAIYLSPHLDDAALSCGGQIFQRTQAGQQVLIVTIMAGDPAAGQPHSDFVTELHTRWQLTEDVVAARRTEDRAACEVLGVEAVHWTVPDCIYRCHPERGAPLYASGEAIFGPIHPAELGEEGLIGTLATRIAGLPPHGQLVAPLAIGHHVDHQMVRRAAETAVPAGLWYYEDYPYVAAPGALAALIPPADPAWRSRVVSLSPTAVAAKIEAIAAFDSQVSTFFNGRSDLEKQIGTFTAQTGGERLWQKAVA